MDEFINRMNKQREILETINKKYVLKEELFGLSIKAIERWLTVNNIDKENKVVLTILKISEKLNFLACRSQEQVTEGYKLLSQEILQLQKELNQA